MTVIKQVERSTIRENIARVGQRFYDEPIQREVSRPTGVAGSVADAFGNLTGVRAITEISHFERRQLRWVVPDGKGGVKPRDAKR